MSNLARSYIKRPVRSAAILTTSYVAGTVIEDTHDFTQLVLLIDFTKGSLTSLEIKVEFSPDNTTFYQETAEVVSTGTSTMSLLEHTTTATGKYRILIPINDRFVKVSVKGTGTVTSSSVTVDALLGVN